MFSSPEYLRHIDALIGADLKGLRDWYFGWLLLSSGIVALGVVLEGPEVLYESKSLFCKRLYPRQETPKWIRWLALMGWIIVAVGVGGEGIAEAFVSQADGLMQTFNDILLGSAERDSAQAILEEGLANERAKNIERRNILLQKELDK